MLRSVRGDVCERRQNVEDLELITVQSSHVPELCAARDCAPTWHSV